MRGRAQHLLLVSDLAAVWSGAMGSVTAMEMEIGNVDGNDGNTL